LSDHAAAFSHDRANRADEHEYVCGKSHVLLPRFEPLATLQAMEKEK
jgi:hypothetical protein